MELSYVKIKSAQYMSRLLKEKTFAARHSQFYELTQWMGINTKHLLNFVIENLQPTSHEEYSEAI